MPTAARGNLHSAQSCLLLSLLFVAFPIRAQETRRQSIEIGALAQTTSNKVTGPYHFVSGPSSGAILGVHHSQLFAGPLVDYTWSLTRSLSIESRASWLPGKQPIVDMSGGSVLLLTSGIRAGLGSGRFSLYGRLAPGLVSFSQAGGAFTPSGGREISRLTHFALEEGTGVEFRIADATALRFDTSRILFVEGGQSGGPVDGLNFVLPGEIENHMTLAAGIAHYFGGVIEPSSWEARNSAPPRNEISISFALQTQPHLAFLGAYLNPDAGVAVSAGRSLNRWLGLDASLVVLPGGDAPNFQDGGTETEFLPGFRIGVAHPRFAVFAKYRAGVVSFPDTVNQDVLHPPAVRDFDFASDLGGIFEYYPRQGHMLLRLDVGEQYTLFHSVTVSEPPPQDSAIQGATYTNSPLMLLGAGWRF